MAKTKAISRFASAHHLLSAAPQQEHRPACGTGELGRGMEAMRRLFKGDFKMRLTMSEHQTEDVAYP